MRCTLQDYLHCTKLQYSPRFLGLLLDVCGRKGQMGPVERCRSKHSKEEETNAIWRGGFVESSPLPPSWCCASRCALCRLFAGAGARCYSWLCAFARALELEELGINLDRRRRPIDRYGGYEGRKEVLGNRRNAVRLAEAARRLVQ